MTRARILLPWAVVVASACAPEPTPMAPIVPLVPPPVDAAVVYDAVAPSPDAMPVAKLRELSISRDELDAVLREGPAAILRVIDVNAAFAKRRFIGWRFDGFTQATALAAADVEPGDLLVSINGKSIARPEHLQRVWHELARKSEAEFRMLRYGYESYSIWLRVAEAPKTATE